MTEAKAIELCLKHRDPLGFEFLVKLFRREAFYHALGFMGNSEDAADVCQEAFSKAFSAMPLLEKLDKFYPWFYSILRNHCLNVLSRKKIAQVKAGQVAEDQYPVVFDPGVVLEKAEDSRIVFDTLGKLDPEFREILVLKYLRDMDYGNISEQLGIPRGTVMSRLYHARKAFRKVYLSISGNEEVSNGM